MVKEDTAPHVYDAKLAGDSPLQDFFEQNRLTVATRFFRNAEMFEQLETTVIPWLLENGLVNREVLRIWSAGCSDGRETYSLAMAVRRALDKQGQKSVSVMIRGSDLSRPQIEIAREGVFRLQSSDIAAIGTYIDNFKTLSDQRYQIDSTIRKSVEFVVEDITQIIPPDPFDILVCSLVLLYYEKEYQRYIIQHLLKTVREDGFLFIAPVNRRWMKTQGYYPVDTQGPFFHLNQVTL
jgi:chemotaxis methyl-accepting protein methylase